MSIFKKIFIACVFLFSFSLRADYSLSQIQGSTDTSLTREIVHLDEEPLLESDAIVEPQEFNYWQQFFRMMFILGLILGVVLLIAWILKSYLNKRIKHVNTQNRIKVLERRNLSQKSMLFLVEVEGKKMVVSDSQSGGVQFLMHLGEEEEVPPDAATKTQNIASKFSFAQILQRKLGRRT